MASARTNASSSSDRRRLDYTDGASQRSTASKPYCKYYANNCCRLGERCPFSHDRSQSTGDDNVCRFYLMGHCAYGSTCRYDHVRPSSHAVVAPTRTTPDSTTSSSSSRHAPPPTTKRQPPSTARSTIVPPPPTTSMPMPCATAVVDRPGRSGLSVGGQSSKQRQASLAAPWKTVPPTTTVAAKTNEDSRSSSSVVSSTSSSSRLNPNARVFVPTSSLNAGHTSATSQFSAAEFDARTAVPVAMDELVFGGDVSAEGHRIAATGGDDEVPALVAQAGRDELILSRPDLNLGGQGAVLGGGEAIFCPYNVLGQCYYGDNCAFVHGDECDLCQQPLLHPTDATQRASHKKECVSEHERAMEASFAEARTAVEKQCGICMEQVCGGKAPHAADSQRRKVFGILPNCRHAYCLECIRKWRAQSAQFENQIIRSCPECRVKSDFVVPSSTWVEADDEKRQLIDGYKQTLGKKHCKYFAMGRSRDTEGECPFGNRCFYRHELPDGTKVPGDSPSVVRRRIRDRAQKRRRQNGGGGDYQIWDFLVDGRRRTFRYGDDTNSSVSIDDADDALLFDADFHQMIDLDGGGLGWVSDDDDDSSDEDSWLMRTLQEELNFLTFRSVGPTSRRHDTSTQAARGGSTAAGGNGRGRTVYGHR